MEAHAEHSRPGKACWHVKIVNEHQKFVGTKCVLHIFFFNISASQPTVLYLRELPTLALARYTFKSSATYSYAS